MGQTTTKSQSLCPDCQAPIEVKKLNGVEFLVWGCACREERLAKAEEERKKNERRYLFKRRQGILDKITNDQFLRGVDGEITFDKLQNKDDNKVQIMKGYLGNLEDNIKSGKSFGLLGKAGRGKTALIICLHKELERRGITSAVVNVQLFFPRLDGMEFSERESKLETLMNAKVLFLDDLFRLEYSQAKRELIYRLLEYRYPLESPTFFASNIYHENTAEIAKIMIGKLGGGAVAEAIVDRLLNSRVGIISFVGGKSFRQRRVKNE